MSKQWFKTNHKGLRYFEHATRKHGKKKDRYYSIRFRIDGTLHTYGVGWLSDGIPEAIRQAEPDLGFEDYCLKLLRQYKGNIKTGTGPKSPREKRVIETEKRDLAEQEKIKAEKENITFDQFMTDTYLPQSKLDKKAKSHEVESMLYKRHMAGIIGKLPLAEVSEIHLNNIGKQWLTRN